MNSNRLAFLDYFFILRPILFFPGWSTMLAGYFIAYNNLIFLPLILPAEISYSRIILLLISYGMLMGSIFVLNQLCDVESDHQNKKLFFIAEGMISPRNALMEVVVLAGISIGTGFLLSPAVGTAYILFFIIAGLLYNYRPFRLKDRPWGSLAANALMGGLAFMIGWLAVQPVGTVILLDILPYLCFNTALYFFTTFPDIEGDRAAAKRTLAVIFGHRRIIVVSFTVYVAGALSALLLNDMQAGFFYLLSLPFFVQTIRTKEIAASIRATKFGILFFALSVCLKWPVYFAVMVTGYFGTRIYFKHRFGMSYPNFLGK
jgi:4-hydroxybenzoate polyprenyltransferase